MKVKEIIASTEWVPSRRYDQDKPLISVLLPTFRRGASGLFMKAARSVLNQSLSELELIIIDDASTDGTADQIKKIMAKDDRVSCLHHPENVGLPAISEYEAFMKARADYLAFAFDDDEFYPHALQKLFDYAAENDSSVIHGHVDMHYFDRTVQKILKVPGFGRQGMPQSSLMGANYISNNAVLLHRRVVQIIGFYDPHTAISRLCDWDLWRRISRGFELVPVDVSVGQVMGPATGDSLGHTHQTEPWQAIEWMNLPRNERLRPENFGEYDILALPDGLSGPTRSAIDEIQKNFKEKFWFSRQSKGPYFPFQAGPGTDCPIENARILVVTSTHDASTSLYFDHLPQLFQQRIRIINTQQWHPEEMIGASIVIFIRHLLLFKDWIEWARKLKIPHYYFLDDNLMLLRKEPAFSTDYAFFTEQNIRNSLESFSGILLSTQKLVDYFRENRLHEKLFNFPPIVHRPTFCDRSGPGPRKGKALRLAYFGGSHRCQPFLEKVLPAIYQFSKNQPVELFVVGISQNTLATSENLKIYYFPYEVSYDLALGRMVGCEIDALLHPNSNTINNPYKTMNVLINAMALNAVPILNNEPPYDILDPEQVALLCEGGPESWLKAIRIVSDQPDTTRMIHENLNRFCHKHYSGHLNGAALDNILKNHPYPGPVLRDTRYRMYIELLRHAANRQEEYQVEDGSQPFTVVSPLGHPNGHVRILNKIKYRFIPKRNRWAGLEVMVGTHHRSAQGKMTLHIRQENGNLVREITSELGNIRDNDWLKFRFSPINDSASIPFVLEFKLVDPGPEDLISLFESNPMERKFQRLIRRLGLKHSGNDLYCRIWFATLEADRRCP